MLTKMQAQMCKERLAEHQHKAYCVDIQLGKIVLNNFFVQAGVFRPETTSGLYFAQFLAAHPGLYSGKKVLDMGCGSGIQAITAATFGAAEVVASDISNDACDNCRQNAREFSKSIRVIESDVFENVFESFDVIVFNHPFFDSIPDKNHPITRAWFDTGRIIFEFLTQAKKHLLPGGIIIMPFFPFAGDTNNPSVHGATYGYAVHTVFEKNINDNNLQKGLFQVFVLRSDC